METATEVRCVCGHKELEHTSGKCRGSVLVVGTTHHEWCECEKFRRADGQGLKVRDNREEGRQVPLHRRD